MSVNGDSILFCLMCKSHSLTPRHYAAVLTLCESIYFFCNAHTFLCKNKAVEFSDLPRLNKKIKIFFN